MQFVQVRIPATLQRAAESSLQRSCTDESLPYIFATALHSLAELSSLPFIYCKFASANVAHRHRCIMYVHLWQSLESRGIECEINESSMLGTRAAGAGPILGISQSTVSFLGRLIHSAIIARRMHESEGASINASLAAKKYLRPDS